METKEQLSKNEAQFLRLYHSKPEQMQVFLNCLLIANTTAPIEDVRADALYNRLKSHSKAELKRAIRAGREYQATHPEAHTLTEAIETTVDFIRRELMQKGAA